MGNLRISPGPFIAGWCRFRLNFQIELRVAYVLDICWREIGTKQSPVL